MVRFDWSHRASEKAEQALTRRREVRPPANSSRRTAIKSSSLLKRSDCLVLFLQDGALHCKNFLTGIEVKGTPILVSVLCVLDRWRRFESIEKLFPGYSPGSVGRAIRKLQAHSLVLEKGSVQARREATLLPWQAWGIEARFYHFATKNFFRAARKFDEKKLNRALLRDSPQPAFIKRYPLRRRLALPDGDAGARSEFPRVLLERRTHRVFGRGHLPLAKFSELLRLTWGVTGNLRWPGLGNLLLKTSPSGGARHPLEVYVWAMRVAGIPPGIYHYRGDRHELELLSRRVRPARLVELCARQEWVRGCAAFFVMSAVFSRTMWRYRFSRAYRVVLLEAGHFCQTFCLVATWLGLAPFCTAALVDEEIEKDLGLDGAAESVLYAAGVGTKA